MPCMPPGGALGLRLDTHSENHTNSRDLGTAISEGGGGQYLLPDPPFWKSGSDKSLNTSLRHEEVIHFWPLSRLEPWGTGTIC